jgi:hypothetical protein
MSDLSSTKSVIKLEAKILTNLVKLRATDWLLSNKPVITPFNYTVRVL